MMDGKIYFKYLKMSSISFLRHAECYHNVDNKYDFLNCCLTDLGIEQASNLKGHFDLIICSPLRRCRETLGFSNIKGNYIEFNELCREKIVNYADIIEHENIHYREDDITFLNRVKKFSEYLEYCQQHNNKILVIAHYLFIEALTSEKLDNAQIYEQSVKKD